MVLDLNHMMRREHRQDQQSRAFYELSALVLNLLRYPPTPIQISDAVATSSRRQPQPSPPTQMTPAGFASWLLGISLALMLCGWITFFIGFLLMPWVLGLVMVFYVVGIVSSLAMIGRAIFAHTLYPKKGVPGLMAKGLLEEAVCQYASARLPFMNTWKETS